MPRRTVKKAQQILGKGKDGGGLTRRDFVRTVSAGVIGLGLMSGDSVAFGASAPPPLPPLNDDTLNVLIKQTLALPDDKFTATVASFETDPVAFITSRFQVTTAQLSTMKQIPIVESPKVGLWNELADAVRNARKYNGQLKITLQPAANGTNATGGPTLTCNGSVTCGLSGCTAVGACTLSC
jgi:hypothetical protein